MMTTTLPSPKDVRDMLADLLFRDITVSPSAPVEPDKPITIAVYVDDNLNTAAVALFDFALSAYAGAAIGLVPPGGAEAAIEDAELPTPVRQNLDEVLNVVSALFNTPGAPHLKLYATYGPDEVPPADISAHVRALGRRLDLAVTVAGYGEGKLSIVIA
jgi:hypothetical protein